MIQDKDLISSYKRTNSVWKTAKEFNLCGQYVHRRLKKFGIVKKINKFSDYEKDKLISIYSLGFKRGDGVLDKLAKELNRTKAFLCRQAKLLGLTNNKRSRNEYLIKNLSKRLAEHQKKYGHCKGFLGRHHSKESINIIKTKNKNAWDNFSEEKINDIILKRAITRKNHIAYRTKCSWKAGYRNIGGINKFYRSKWEANYARYLQELKETGIILSWEHEPDSFIMTSEKGKTTIYVPDFKVFREIEGKTYFNYHEVKGWNDERSKKKIEEFKKRYGDSFLNVVYKKEYDKIKNEFSSKIEGWEF